MIFIGNKIFVPIRASTFDLKTQSAEEELHVPNTVSKG